MLSHNLSKTLAIRYSEVQLDAAFKVEVLEMSKDGVEHCTPDFVKELKKSAAALITAYVFQQLKVIRLWPIMPACIA